jgi:hypothetical protein
VVFSLPKRLDKSSGRIHQRMGLSCTTNQEDLSLRPNQLSKKERENFIFHVLKVSQNLRPNQLSKKERENFILHVLKVSQNSLRSNFINKERGK